MSSHTLTTLSTRCLTTSPLFQAVVLFLLPTPRRQWIACLSCRLRFLSSLALTRYKCGSKILQNTTNWKKTSTWPLAQTLPSMVRPSSTPDTLQTMIWNLLPRSTSGWSKMHQVSRKLSMAYLNTQTLSRKLKMWNSLLCTSSNGERQFPTHSHVPPKWVQIYTTWSKSTDLQAMEAEDTKASG